MMRRLLWSAVVIAAWFTAGVLLDACYPIERPSGGASQVQNVQEQAIAKPVWLWSIARLFRLDTTTAKVGEQTQEVLSEAASTRDKRVQYFVTTESRDGHWNLALAEVDVFGSLPVRSFPLLQVIATDRNAYEDVYAARPLLTADETIIYVAVTEHRGKSWVTSLVRLDLTDGTVSKPLSVFDAPAPWGANVNLALSRDEKRIYLVRTFDDKVGADSPIATRVAVVQTEPLEVQEVWEIGEPIIAESVWSDVLVAPNGQELYLLETLWKQDGNPGLDFVSVGLEDGQVHFKTELVRDTLDTGCDVRWRFVPNGTDLWTWCSTKVQYLDPDTGKISFELPLQDPLKGIGLAEYVLAKDGKTLYMALPMSREIIVADVEARTVVRSVQLQDRALAPNFGRTLAQLFYNTADAKMGGRPMVAMNLDETWIAFTEIKSYDAGDGVWVVDLATLEPKGHWLRGQEISSVRASQDGSELYAIDVDLNQMLVLDPMTGNVLRSLRMPLVGHAGMLADVQR